MGGRPDPWTPLEMRESLYAVTRSQLGLVVVQRYMDRMYIYGQQGLDWTAGRSKTEKLGSWKDVEQRREGAGRKRPSGRESEGFSAAGVPWTTCRQHGLDRYLGQTARALESTASPGAASALVPRWRRLQLLQHCNTTISAGARCRLPGSLLTDGSGVEANASSALGWNTKHESISPYSRADISIYQ